MFVIALTKKPLGLLAALGRFLGGNEETILFIVNIISKYLENSNYY